jgi:hypothetical protein
MLLLRAAVAAEDEAVAAWREWRQITEFDAAGWDQFQLLPLAARNLPAGELDAEVAGRIAGLRRLTWSRNQVLFHAAGGAISALVKAEINPLVLKGAALAELAYGDAGIRPMFDVDLLVPPQRARDAIAVLAKAGWASSYEDPTGRLQVHHSVGLSQPPGGEIDLHWQSLWLAADDTPLWEAAVPVEFGGVRARAVGPADNLLIVCAHGLPWAEVPAIRWAADAVTLIRSADPSLDWDRVCAEARRRRLSIWAAVALRFLREELGVAAVPREVVERLAAEPASRAEVAALTSAMRPDSPLRTWRLARERHRRLRSLGGGETPPGFLAFAREFWGVERTAELPLHAARGISRAARVRLSSGRGSARSAS